MTDNSLAVLDKATQMLAEVRSIDDASKLIDLAEAARYYAKQSGLGLEAQNHAAEIKLRAQRRGGEILRQMEKAKAGRHSENRLLPTTDLIQSPTYAELGIEKRQAHVWQTLAAVPEAEFIETINETKEKNEELTTATIYRTIKEMAADERTRQRDEIAKKAASAKLSDKWRIYHGDIETWSAPEQYDFIITDPPYPKEYLYLYEVLAKRANEWLRDGGLLIAMCGQSYLDKIYEMMSKHIRYYWTACYLTPGQPTPLRQVNVNTTWKPLLIFSKGDYKGRIFGDVFTSDGNDKSLHKWGQSESGMYSIIKGIVLEGQKILDPFCGAGTTGIAAIKHNCFFTGLDVDEKNVSISTGRLSEYDTEAQRYSLN